MKAKYTKLVWDRSVDDKLSRAYYQACGEHNSYEIIQKMHSHRVFVMINNRLATTSASILAAQKVCEQVEELGL